MWGRQSRDQPGGGGGGEDPGQGRGGPLPSLPGWPAAPRTAPPAPRCIPGAAPLQARQQPGRCSLILSCLCSWAGWKSGNRTHAMRSPPFISMNPRKLKFHVHASSSAVSTGVISCHRVYVLFMYSRNMPVGCSSLPWDKVSSVQPRGVLSGQDTGISSEPAS